MVSIEPKFSGILTERYHRYEIEYYYDDTDKSQIPVYTLELFYNDITIISYQFEKFREFLSELNILRKFIRTSIFSNLIQNMEEREIY